MRGSAFFTAFLFCVLLTSTASGQATSSLRGTVVDAQGAAIPGVTVQLTNEATGFVRDAFSDATGAYQFVAVPPGTYLLTSGLEGFNTVRSTVTLQVNTPATLDVTLELAALSEVITVEARIATLNRVDASVGNAFGELQVRQLPLATRNVVELLSLQPGVAPSGEVAGARRDQNNITLDGVDINDNETNGVTSTSQGGLNTGGGRAGTFNGALPVPLDSVQEFRVTVAGQNASEGRSSGGQVSLVTKSGTNEFRGSAYEYNRDTRFASNSWFNNRAGLDKEQLGRNQYGSSFGGPVKRGRIFFFGNVERRTDESSETQTRTVPSAALRAGTIMVAANNGQTYALTPDILKRIDPLGTGVNPHILALYNELPEGNDPSLGRDRGLNFSGFRFNAPKTLDHRAYVFKVDGKLDAASNHNLSVRGTFADNAEDATLAQFPGMAPASMQVNNSYGVGASYTSVLSPSVVNVASVGLTTIRSSRTGVTDGASFGLDGISSPVSFTRPNDREAPTWNIVNDLSWTRGMHSLTMGGNVRFVRNQRTNYGNAFPSFSVSRSVAQGLGSDVNEIVNGYLAATYGPGVAMADAQSVQRAVLNTFGVITSGSMNYSYGRDGQVLPIGTPTVRTFATNELEFYVGDNWRVKPDLTLTYGVRYLRLGVPYETSGMQVAPTYPLQEFWKERLAGMAAGIPTNQLEHAIMTFDFNGPVNGKESWYSPDNNNFAPRIAAAWSPQSGFFSKLTGGTGAIRAGVQMAYDRFGSSLVTNWDNSTSFGLSELTRTPTVNTTNGQRWNGVGIDLPPGPTHVFPFTPPEVNFIGGSYMGIDTTLRAPRSLAANLSVSREIKWGNTLEVGYIGRSSRDLLMQTDAGGWAIQLVDPASGQTWKEMAWAIRDIRDSGITPAQVRANPSLVAPIPWIENMAPALRNLYFPGSASANYYDLVWRQMSGSDADAVHTIDRVRSAQFPNCIIKTGCYTLYPQQSSALSMWTNAGRADYHAGTFTLRKPLSRGFAYDVNYTLGVSKDNGGAPDSGAGSGGGIMLNPYDLDTYYGYSDADSRHLLNLNMLAELPFGRGKAFLGNAGGLTDALVGGWQLTGIFRYRSGLPTSVLYGGLWPTNFGFSTTAYPTGDFDATPEIVINNAGNPGLFEDPRAAAANWQPMKPGEIGPRAAMRMPARYNTDLALTKRVRFRAGHNLQFRAEAFNAFNNVIWTNVSLDANNPARFGEFTATAEPRVMQFAVRYEF